VRRLLAQELRLDEREEYVDIGPRVQTHNGRDDDDDDDDDN